MTELGGDESEVPDWKNGDFDGIYVIRVAGEGREARPVFRRETQNLDGLPAGCPGGARP